MSDPPTDPIGHSNRVPIPAEEGEGLAGVEAELASMGAMARLFAGNTRAAEWACQLNCRHRTLAGWAAAPTHDSCRPVPGAVAERSLTQIPSLTTSGLGSGHAVQLTWPSCHRVSCESA